MQEVGHSMMGLYHSTCNPGDIGGSHVHDWFNNPDATHLTDEVGDATTGGIGDEGHNDDFGYGVPENRKDVGSHSAQANDAMGQGVTFSTDSRLDFKVWKSLEFSGPPGPMSAEEHGHDHAGHDHGGEALPREVLNPSGYMTADGELGWRSLLAVP